MAVSGNVPEPTSSVEWEARTAATRYLCAAAHLRRSMLPRKVRDGEGEQERDPHPVGRAFARRVIRGPGIVVACPGVDTAWVIRHAHASWTQTVTRDGIAVGTLALCGYYFRIGTAIWVGLIIAALVLSAVWKQVRRGRALAAMLVACIAAAAVGVVLHGGSDGRGLRTPLLWFPFCLLVFAVDSFIASVRVRRLSRALGRVPNTPFPFGPLTGDLDAAAELERLDVVYYEGQRIVGAGTPRSESTLITPIDEPQEGHRVERFEAFDLLDYIAHHIRRQGVRGDSTFGLPQLEVREVLARPISASKGPATPVTRARISAAANSSTAGATERAYVMARATTPDGQIASSIYVFVELVGRALRLTVMPYVMAPVVDELRAADEVASRATIVNLAMSPVNAVVEIAWILQAVRARMHKTLARWMNNRASSIAPAPSAAPARPGTRSLREFYAKQRTDDLFQRHDGSGAVQVMEQRVFAVVETFLEEHGIATERFRAQADHVISTYITVNGDNNNVAAGPGANAGNTGAPAARPNQSGA